MNEPTTEKPIATIPFFCHEMEMTRLESVNRRLAWLAVTGWAVAGTAIAVVFFR